MGLKHEKSRIVRIKRIFIIVDVLVGLGVIPGILWAGFSQNYPIIVILGTLNIEAALLAYFSFRIGKIVRIKLMRRTSAIKLFTKPTNSDSLIVGKTFIY